MKSGLFITVEGIDGCGKSTQAQLLAQHLTAQGKTVYLTKNPGDTELGQELRQILLHTTAPVHARAEMLLYVADRTQHWFQQVLPRLQAGQVVICDRYIDSTIAYQGYGRGESVDWILALHEQALANEVRRFWPDITLWFDAPVDVCLARVQARNPVKDRLEQENTAFYERVRQAFDAQFFEHSNRIKKLDATQTADLISVNANSLLQEIITMGLA
jgi:dTMP kinase